MAMLHRRAVLRGAAATAFGVAVGQAGTAAPAAAAPVASPGRPGPARPLDGRPAPGYDYSRANKLPREMTGYWEKTFDVGGVTRTAKAYISPETPIRSYYTVLAVPDGVDTGEFLRRTGWRDIADERGEGLFVLEPGPEGWGAATAERAYVDAAMAFYQANVYFSIFGLHYLVGYDAGAPALEAWAAAFPLRVIAQAYIGSAGLPADYLRDIGRREFDGTTEGDYIDVVFPEGFDLIRYDEVVLPTWYLDPRQGAASSLAYWRQANDAGRPGDDPHLGTVYRQRRDSGRWMTSFSGPISQVAVRNRPVGHDSRRTTREVLAFLTSYSRYENFFAYGNQLVPRADYDRLGVEVRTMTVGGRIREFIVHVPESARRLWGRRAPVVFVWPGNTQTDKVFFDSAQWWQVARSEGCVLVVVCEQYSASAISVSHADSDAFFRQLRDLVSREYDVDPTRFYSTGQSAGSRVAQFFAAAKPDYFAAVASTSFAPAPGGSGTIAFEGATYPAARRPIPTCLMHGYGDLPFLEGDLWDDIENDLDTWAAYHLKVNGLTLDDVDLREGRPSGWHDRFRTWTWRDPASSAPVVRVTRNLYRSHNNIPEETPMLWEFMRHYRREVDGAGRVTRYYSPSGFRRHGDETTIPS
jgi:poly(3-hydroxybutyrate) depolymerase